jgi:hypothetical protein
MTQAMKRVATVYHEIGEMHAEQPKRDLEPLLDSLYAYKGMLSTLPDIVHVQKVCNCIYNYLICKFFTVGNV